MFPVVEELIQQGIDPREVVAVTAAYCSEDGKTMRLHAVRIGLLAPEISVDPQEEVSFDPERTIAIVDGCDRRKEVSVIELDKECDLEPVLSEVPQTWVFTSTTGLVVLVTQNQQGIEQAIDLRVKLNPADPGDLRNMEPVGRC